MKQSLSDKIYQQIKDDITYGKLTPGQNLTETELTKRFKVSKSPIREALYQLVAEGLITFDGVKNKKISVTKLSVEEVDEVFNLRVILESHAARLLAEKATAKDVDALKSLNDKCIEASRNQDVKQWIVYNTRFHDYFVEHCGNSTLIPILDNLKRKVYRYKYIIASVPGHSEDYLKDHEAMIKACEENDGELAETHIRHHLKAVNKVLIQYLSFLPNV